jgi:hypothetical protein
MPMAAAALAAGVPTLIGSVTGYSEGVAVISLESDLSVGDIIRVVGPITGSVDQEVEQISIVDAESVAVEIAKPVQEGDEVFLVD